jgi:hypothetical protein
MASRGCPTRPAPVAIHRSHTRWNDPTAPAVGVAASSGFGSAGGVHQYRGVYGVVSEEVQEKEGKTRQERRQDRSHRYAPFAV